MSENKDTLAVLRKQSFFLAMGLTLLVDGALACMVKADFFPFTLSQIWPVFVIIAGLIVFGADLFIFRRIRTSFLFPSVMLVILGSGFLVFSTDLFHVSFRKIISVFWPVVLIVFGIFLLAVYEIQRINYKKFPYMQDDTLEEDNY